MLIIRRTSELKFPDEYETPHESSYQGHSIQSWDTRLIDNKIWTRDELRKLRGKTARARDKRISNSLHEVHRPWYERESEHQESTDSTQSNSGRILFDLT